MKKIRAVFSLSKSERTLKNLILKENAMGYGYGWAPYVPIGERFALAKIYLQQRAKEGLVVQPIDAFKGKITRTFWGNQWCSHIESLQDSEFRLDRGKTYVRNGSVFHLAIERGKVSAIVAGSIPYTVNIEVEKIKRARWNAIKQNVVGHIDSLFDLLQGKLSDEVMSQLADAENGLFPKLDELSFRCTCPDAYGMRNWMCKHTAAVFYGIGRRLETNPELLFILRGVKSEDLIAAGTQAKLESHIDEDGLSLQNDELENIFGIELAPTEEKAESAPQKPGKAPDSQSSKVSKKAAPRKKTTETDADKTASVKKTPGKTKSNKTVYLSITVTASDQKKIQKAVDKSGLSRSAFIVARLKESFKKDSDSNEPTRKLKRSKRAAKKDVHITVKILPSEKKKIQQLAKRTKKSVSQFVYDVLFE